MNPDEIKNRMLRVYSSIGQRYDSEIEKHFNMKNDMKPDAEGIMRGIITFSFDKKGEIDAKNEVFHIISDIAKLKDNLKKVMSAKKLDPSVIEKEVSASTFLTLIIDLDNLDKHGQDRSGSSPRIENIKRALKISSSEKGSGYITFGFDGLGESSNTTTVLSAEIKDKDNKLICYFDELVSKSIEKWEEIIQKFGLSS